MVHNLSRRQYDVFTTIQRLAGERNYMPSVRELAEALNLSPATTQQHLSALRRKGYIETDGTAHGMRLLVTDGEVKPPASMRPIKPTLRPMAPRGDGPRSALREPPAGAVTSPQLSPELELEPVVFVPLVGTIAAGQPIEALEVVRQTVPVSASMARSGDYLLQISGDSMIEDGIFNGDFVVIRPQKTVHNGQIAVGLLEDGTATLKRIYREKGRFRLQPANASMEPIYVDRLEVQGRLVGLVRMYH